MQVVQEHGIMGVVSSSSRLLFLTTVGGSGHVVLLRGTDSI
jgi:hypothetical protein